MKRQLIVQGTIKLRDGTVILTGSVDGPDWEKGPLVHMGQRGVATTRSGERSVEIIGVALIDRTITKPNMEMIQVRVIEGDLEFPGGTTIMFDDNG